MFRERRVRATSILCVFSDIGSFTLRCAFQAGATPHRTGRCPSMPGWKSGERPAFHPAPAVRIPIRARWCRGGDPQGERRGAGGASVKESAAGCSVHEVSPSVALQLWKPGAAVHCRGGRRQRAPCSGGSRHLRPRICDTWWHGSPRVRQRRSGCRRPAPETRPRATGSSAIRAPLRGRPANGLIRYRSASSRVTTVDKVPGLPPSRKRHRRNQFRHPRKRR